MSMLKIAIVLGSTRPNRVGEIVQPFGPGRLKNTQVISWGAALKPIRG